MPQDIGQWIGNKIGLWVKQSKWQVNGSSSNKEITFQYIYINIYIYIYIYIYTMMVRTKFPGHF